MRSLLRILLFVVATSASFVLLELGLTAWYGDLATPGPQEIVEAYDSPFIFKARFDPFEREIEAATPSDDGLGTAANGRRILSYADTMASGYILRASSTYAKHLEDRLAARSQERVQVFDMERGFSPTTYSFHVRLDAPRLEPDGVMMQIELLSDVSDEAMLRTTGRKDNSHGFPLEIHRSRYTLGWHGHVLAPLSIAGSFVERTRVYAVLSQAAGRLMNRVVPNPVFGPDSRTVFFSRSAERWLLTVGALGAGFDRLFDSILATQSFLESRGVEFLLVILPSRYVYTDDRFSESSLSLLKRAEQRAQEKKIHYVSTWEALGEAGGADLFLDFGHLTADGHRAVADIVEPIVAGW
jgi:hypothetical protein